MRRTHPDLIVKDSSYPGLIVQNSYWRWPQHNLAGNTIDFFLNFYDPNPARSRKPLRWQFEQIYDHKKVRNTESSPEITFCFCLV